MKQLLTIITFILVCRNIALSQDTIVKIDNTIIISKILELNDSTIKYKRYNMEDGPLYTINKSEIQGFSFFDINNEILIDYITIIEKRRNDSIMNAKLKAYYEHRKLLLSETKPIQIPTKKGWHLGINRAIGINSLHESENKDNNGGSYITEENIGTLQAVGFLTRNHLNNKFSIKSGLLLRLLQYTQNTCNINELSVPIALSVHFGRKIAFIGELGASFNFPYRRKTKENIYQLQKNYTYTKRMKLLALNQTAHIGLLLYFNKSFSMDIGLNQMYSSISYTRFYSREIELSISACLYYKINS
jgi:hypothetical protein